MAGELARTPRNDGLLAQLDEKVSKLGGVSWELGPGRIKPNMLVITPDGNKNLLSVTRGIVDLAPSLEEWEFHSAKPPKAWQLRFSLEHVGREVSIDAARWQYVLYRYPDRSLDVVIFAPELRDLGESLRLVAARIVLDGILGEARRLECISGIEVIVEQDNESSTKASRIQVLPDHLDKMCPK